MFRLTMTTMAALAVLLPGEAYAALPGAAAAARAQARSKAQAKKEKKAKDAEIQAVKKEIAARAAKVEAARSGTLAEYLAAMGDDGGPAPVLAPHTVRLVRKSFGFKARANAKAWVRWVVDGDLEGASTVEKSMREKGELIDLDAGSCLTVIRDDVETEHRPLPEWGYRNRPADALRDSTKAMNRALLRVVSECQTQDGLKVYIPHVLLSKERAASPAKAR